MIEKSKVPEWLKRAKCFFTRADGGYNVENIVATPGVSNRMATDRKRKNRPVVDKKAALYQTMKNSNIKNEG